MLHPRKDHKGKPLILKSPSQPSSMDAWWDNRVTACVVPDGDMPEELCRVPFNSVRDLPLDPASWEQRAAGMVFDEPAFNVPAGLEPAAGVVIRELDGRIWCVAPSNRFGGYTHTFPKGRLDGKSLKATALVEAFEECGLLVHLTGFLVDTKRSTTYTRYYMAERVSGSPADMGWESQAVLLAPVPALFSLLNNANDLPILRALQDWLAQPRHWILPARAWHWNTLPMPAQHTKLPLEIRLSAEEATALRLGYVPREQEEKWFAYFQDNTLFQHRSWTGFCIDQIHFEQDGDGLRATHAIVNRDSEQYLCTDDSEDIGRIESMVKDLVQFNLNRLSEVQIS